MHCLTPHSAPSGCQKKTQLEILCLNEMMTAAAAGSPNGAFPLSLPPFKRDVGGQGVLHYTPKNTEGACQDFHSPGNPHGSRPFSGQRAENAF